MDGRQAVSIPSRNALLLLILYLIGVVALYVWVAGRLERAAWHIMEETARLLGHEVSVAVARALNDGREQARRGEPAPLENTLKAVPRSPMIDGVTLVGAGGEVLAEQGTGRPPGRLPDPEDLFGRDRRARLVGIRGNRLSASLFLLDVPVMRGGRPVAYLHLTLNSRRISRLYADARHTLLLSSALGLLVIGGLGFALHLQLARRERLVVHALQGALSGRPAGAAIGRPGVPLVLDVAERVGQTLQAERSRTAHAHSGLSYLGSLLDVGVLLATRSGEVEFIGQRASSLLGLDGSAADEGKLARLFQAVLPALEAVQASGEQVAIDLPIEGPGGTHELRCYVQPFEEGAAPSVAVILRDKAVLQAIETDMRQAAQMRWLGRYYVGATHDLKAPLNALVLNAELLKHTIDSPDWDDAERETRDACLAAIEADIARLRFAVETLLSQAAPPQGEKETFDLRDLLVEVERLVRSQAQHQRVRVRLELPPGEVDVFANRDVIKQAVLNLASNAIEAMAWGGALTLRLDASGAVARLQVTDTGPGVPEGVRERIFDLHVSTKGSGTGVGLYVARSSVEDEDGFLRLADTGPAGTTFELGLPLVEGRA